MPMALQTVQLKSQDLQEGECLAHGVIQHDQQGNRSRPYAMPHSLSNIGFEHEKGQLREWMTVARDRTTWGMIVDSRLGLPTGSFTNLPKQ
jgi:hypothetical protein